MQTSVRFGTTTLGLPALAHAIARGLCMCLVTPVTLYRLSAEIPDGKDGVKLFIRGVAGVGSMLCKYSCIARLPLTESTAVTFTAPAFTIALAKLVLDEDFLLADVVAAFFCFIGVLFIAKSPGFVDEPHVVSTTSIAKASARREGIMFGLASAILTAASYVTTRSMGRRVHHQWNVLASGIVTILMCIALLGGSVSDIAQLAVSSKQRFTILTVTAFSAYLGTTAVNWSLQLLHAGTLSVLRNVDLPLSFVLGYFCLGEKHPSVETLFGAALIACTGLALGLSKFIFAPS